MIPTKMRKRRENPPSLEAQQELPYFSFKKTRDPYKALKKMNKRPPQEPTRLELLSTHVRSGQLSHDSVKPDTWRSLPEIPDKRELMADTPLEQLGSHEREPTEKLAYLAKQYFMYRCEGTELLRRAIYRLREDPDMKETSEIFIYTQVHVQGYQFSKIGAACRVSFSTERSPIKVQWGQSDRLTPGTLVALSPTSDSFRKRCLVAVVAFRYLVGGLEPDLQNGENQKTPPRIELFWADNSDARFDPTEDLIMLEARGGYFEPVRHAMVGLQHAAFYNSKFDKYIIGGHRSDNRTTCLQGQVPKIPQEADFDSSQKNAFERITTRELAIVQGPPGTGKTYTSIIALESLVKSSKMHARVQKTPLSPIIVAAQTNHALDQLLKHCIGRDIKVARLGGRSKDEDINARTMFSLRSSSRAHRGGGRASYGAILARARETLEMYFPRGFISPRVLEREGFISQAQASSLYNGGDDDDGEWETAETDGQGGSPMEEVGRWLGANAKYEDIYVYSSPEGQIDVDGPNDWEIGRDGHDERDQVYGEFVPIEFGPIPAAATDNYHQVQQDLKKHSNLYNIPEPKRGPVYRYLRHLLMQKAKKDFLDVLERYHKICQDLKISRWENNIAILQHEAIEVIGCTTTGLTKYRGLLAALKPRILLIEEAAETREANITSAIYPSLDQIILIGDHQQLVPHVDVSFMTRPPYNLHVSLFERLVNLDLPYTMLQVQRRIVPAVSEVVRTFYPTLMDHQSVRDPSIRPLVSGMGAQRLWWFQHQWPENQNENDTSFFNAQEAEMIVGFACYLIQNDVEPDKITILSYYKGQLDFIQKLLRQNDILAKICPNFRDWVVRTVDGFQGEESDVIILSLVRSPQTTQHQAKVGFVENENRAVVATSRARRGMYIFGNSNNILRNAQSRQTWEKVYRIFEKRKALGYIFPIVCKTHNRITEIREPANWVDVPEGGCTQQCDQTCTQGHECERACHPKTHDSMRCTKKCKLILRCGHKCIKKCGETCDCAHGCNRPALQAVTTRPAPSRLTPSVSASTQKPCNNSQLSRAAAQNRSRVNNHTGSQDRGCRDRGAKGAASKQTPRMSTPVMTPSIEPQQRAQEAYITSQAIMNRGYRNYIADEGTKKLQIRDGPEALIPIATLPRPTTPISQIASAARELTVAGRWGQAVMETDANMQAAREAQSGSTPMQMIRETYTPVFTDGGTRILQRSIRIENTHSDAASSQTSDTSIWSFVGNRKAEARAAGAGFESHEPSDQGKATPAEMNSVQKQAKLLDINAEEDLISFK